MSDSTLALHLPGTFAPARPSLCGDPARLMLMPPSPFPCPGLASRSASLFRRTRAGVKPRSLYIYQPQREGGGNNFYREALAAKLLAGGPELSAYILMERIQPAVNRSLVMREGHVTEGEVLSELGIYGVVLRVGSELLLDKAAGHLLRTKNADSDEGGVNAGYAFLDSPFLI